MAIQPSDYNGQSHHQSVDSLGLEQFATSIAALANGDTTPVAVLEHVLATIAENLNEANRTTRYSTASLLQAKAYAYGFDSIEDFRRHLIHSIGERMVDLQFSKLSAEQRKAHK